MCLIYLNDVITFSNSAAEHSRDADPVLEVLRHAGISLKFEKCLFFTNSVRYLKHIVRPGTLEVDDSHMRALRQAKPPRTPSELLSFLGSCNVYRRFDRDCTKTAKPLYYMLKVSPSEITKLDEKQLESFRHLVKAVTEPPVLALPKLGSMRWLVSNEHDVFVVIMESDFDVHTFAVDTRLNRRIIVDNQ